MTTLNGSALKVLVVDDNAEMRLLMRSLLESAAVAEIREAGSVDSAWEALAGWRPDIALVDYQMPGTEGGRLIEWIRAAPDPTLARLPVIMITGHSASETLARATASGANDFIVKPFNARVLLSRIERCLRDPRTIADMVSERHRGSAPEGA
ncbi:response regulator [Pararhodospirillum oryzae]|uniref:Response regulatory domain-containing protein n=1 Tax=Pararhodospirillum oryzae TaxID=478448 RepID=A0A512HA74_9PROT|nr:response regulator [Pararhodospirillum oryzae]GEO82342.1 hypothetical protein ROR02_24730 [Pararhodospirillum oryzae]